MNELLVRDQDNYVLKTSDTLTATLRSALTPWRVQQHFPYLLHKIWFSLTGEITWSHRKMTKMQVPSWKFSSESAKKSRVRIDASKRQVMGLTSRQTCQTLPVLFFWVSRSTSADGPVSERSKYLFSHQQEQSLLLFQRAEYNSNCFPIDWSSTVAHVSQLQTQILSPNLL